MSEENNKKDGLPGPCRGPRRCVEDVHWVEIFKDKVAERLKDVLQEEMDWMTSPNILERLNRLHSAELAREKSEGENAEEISRDQALRRT